uniref:Peptidase S1 domain-containing protein n=1 Tax=Heliothis virescens TaxID=7102 RepID=A0A2A4K714_HELVI
MEGEPCHTEKAEGKCVHIFKCLSTVLDIKNKEYPQICSFRGKEPVVCCTDCELVNDTRDAVVDNKEGIYFKNGRKARDKCIEYLTKLPDTCETKGLKRFWNSQDDCHIFENGYPTVVVGGLDVDLYRYPHMALLGFGQDESSASWLCGGSLISETFVLTAAHCRSSHSLGPVRFVAMGILKRSEPEERWQVFTITRVITHPDYAPPSKYHDIALLELSRPITYSKEVFPACIDVGGGPHSSAAATGWGKLGKNSPLADNLQEVNLEEFSASECRRHFPPHRLLKRGYMHKMQMCYGGDAETEPRDTCEGDSGGPLQVVSELSKCLRTIIGVTSYGRACGYAGVAGMYTRVHHYVPWIESIVWPD